MTLERLMCVAAALDDQQEQLLSDIRSAAGRAGQADPGDRLDIIRYEAFSSQLELWAFSVRDQPGNVTFELGLADVPEPAFADTLPLPTWVPPVQRAAAELVVAGRGVLVALRLPVEVGARASAGRRAPVPPAAKPWQAEPKKVHRKDGSTLIVDVVGSRAVEQRFKDQLEAALAAAEPEPIYPTGIQNRVLSDTLRDFVNQPNGERVVAVPVEYRDGSRAQHPFPLRSLKLIPVPEEPHDLSLRMSLLSIRHTEMDAIVDGAWLRNSQISQVRPQAETDDLVYGISLEQFEVLTDMGSRRLRLAIFQTGLEPANVGFYRAVTRHLLTYPGSLSVVPQYYQQPRPPGAQPGRSQWRNHRRSKPEARRAQSEFVTGKVWATRRGASR